MPKRPWPYNRFRCLGICSLLAVSWCRRAAESALPGNPLYIIKLKINEPLVAALKVSDTAKAEWQTQVAARRLEEADKLALAHQLNDGAKSEIEASFIQSSAGAAAKIATLSANGDAAAASNISTKFESTLKAHAEILAQIGAGEGNDSTSLSDAVSAALNTATEVSGNQDATLAAKASTSELTAAAAAKIALAKKAIAGVTGYIGRNNASLGVDATAAATQRIGQANALAAEAELKLTAGTANDALSLANQALRAAQETRVLAEAQVSSGQAVTAAAPASQGADTVSVTADRSVNFLEESSDTSTDAAAKDPLQAVLSPESVTTVSSTVSGTGVVPQSSVSPEPFSTSHGKDGGKGDKKDP
jgi:hypothetical protein